MSQVRNYMEMKIVQSFQLSEVSNKSETLHKYCTYTLWNEMKWKYICLAISPKATLCILHGHPTELYICCSLVHFSMHGEGLTMENCQLMPYMYLYKLHAYLYIMYGVHTYMYGLSQCVYLALGMKALFLKPRSLIQFRPSREGWKSILPFTGEYNRWKLN